MTSDNSREPSLNPLISSVGVCLASRIHKPVSSNAKKTNATYGRRCFALLRR